MVPTSGLLADGVYKGLRFLWLGACFRREEAWGVGVCELRLNLLLHGPKEPNTLN